MERLTNIKYRRKPETKAKKFLAIAYTLSFRFAFKLVLVALIAMGTVGGCDGDGGNGGKDEFRIFRVGFSGFQFGEDFFGECLEANTAVLVLKLLFDGANVSGSAELLGFDMTGPSNEIAGIVEGDNISFQPFSVSVDDGKDVVGFGPSSVNFSFNTFEGLILGNDGDQFPDEITGSASGMLIEVLEGDILICNGSFTVDFLAIAEDN